MRIKNPTLIVIATCWSIPTLAADAPDFNTFYSLYKTADTQNDITITGDITATRLISVPGAENTIINGGGFNFNGGRFSGFTISSGYNFTVNNVGAFTSDGTTVSVNDSFNSFANSPEGGVISNLGGNVAINNSAFSNNSSAQGGGVFYQNNNATLNATNNAFGNNHATHGDGGVIYNEYETTATFNTVYFLSNSASDYGGVAFNDGTLNISDAAFISNTASNGGALYNSNTMNLTNVVFRENTANSGAGAIYTTGDMNLSDGVFENNSGETGGAIGNYGIIGDTLYSVISNSEFSNNTAEYGGAIYNWDDIYVIDSNFTNNSATSGGGAIFNLSELYIIANNKDVMFNGNTLNGVSNAIESSGTINMNANTNNTITFSDSIAGTGEIIFNRPYIFNETNVPTGGTIILDNSMSGFSGNISIYNGTVKLGDSGTFFDADNLNVVGGILDIGTKSVNANNASFSDDSTLAITVNNDTTYGFLSANSWSVASGANLDITLSPNAMNNQNSMRIQLLRGGITSDTFTPHINNNIYSFTKIGNGWYEINQTGNYSDVIKIYGGTQNNQNTAAAWHQQGPMLENNTGRAVYNRMNALMQTDGIAYVHALTALAPATAPLVQIIGTSVIDRFDASININDRRARDANHGVIWINGFLDDGQLDGTEYYADFDISGYGGSIGAEFGRNKWVIGAAYTYQYDEMSSWSRNIYAPTAGVGLYAEYDSDHIIWRSKAAAFYTDMDETKYVANINIYNNPLLYTFGAWSDIGYKFAVKNIQFVPRGGIRYINIHRTSSTDSATQFISSGDTQFITAHAGITTGLKNINIFGINIIPELNIGASYDMRSDKDNALVNINNQTYEISSARLGRTAAYGDITARMQFGKNSEIQINANAEFRDGYQNYTIGISGIAKF